MLSIKKESIILIKYIKTKEAFACFPFANATENYFQPNTNRGTQNIRKAFVLFFNNMVVSNQIFLDSTVLFKEKPK